MRFNKRQYETCFYCGMYGNHRDHVNPKTFSGKDWFDKIEYVFACKECNCTLGSTLAEIPERIELLINRYKSKYHLMMPVVEWSLDEIEELGLSLRRRIKKKLVQRRKAEERVIYLNYVLNEFKK